jgi:site-specific DNA-methyltransferase (adenine-specific)
MGSLYFGDNLHILREHIKDESIDLVYLDPPFNSKRDYNLLFRTPKGQESDAQISAFDDTWHWGEQAEREFSELLHQENTDVSEMIQSLRRFLKESDMMAYLVMMANRLLELHRVLKSSGSLYLHCDPTASHYLKIVLDAVFGVENYRNEITWKRTSSHNDARRNFSNLNDILFFYTKSDKYLFVPQHSEYSAEYIENNFRYVDENGRRYSSDNLRSPNPRPNLTYDYKGYKPHANGWTVSLERMQELDRQGRLIFPENPDGRIRIKKYLDEMSGVVIGNVWDDISPISSQAAERLGYPTQKPLALLERIIKASSNEGDVILDPFCGCGTAVYAAETLKREWIGIDITHLAISLIEKRMRDAFPSITFDIHGTPKDLGGARNLAERDKYQFQWWACSLVNAQPFQGKKKGADGGIDGIIYFQDDEKGAKKIIVSVKGGESVTRTMIADLKNSVEREKAEIGLFVTLAEATKPMITEAASAGFYESPHMGAFPKIQILTIDDLLSGREKPKYPDFSRGGLSFKKAKIEQQRAAQNKLEGF